VAGILRIANHLSIDFLKHWKRSPCFSVSSYELVKGLALCGVRPTLVIDVGANVGQFGVAAADRFKPAHVICFEPNPEAARILRRNVQSIRAISVREMGIGGTPGSLMLRVNAHSHSSSFRPLTGKHLSAFPFATELNSIEVPVSTLDDEFPSIVDISQGLLKLDVQGFEREVLMGAENVLLEIKWVVMEVSFEPLYEGEWIFEEARQFMQSRGFRFERPVGFLTEKAHGQIVQMDALFSRIE
jgi:FkbM family methyltransferase